MNRKIRKRPNTVSKVQGPYPDLALHTIGWKAFQDLCAQVCEAELGCPVEIYREAQDGGQDATFLIPSTINKVAVIGTVQCKHVSDGTKRLKPSDLTPELDKVKTLVSEGQADTYIFMTNMGTDAPVAKAMRKTLQELGVKKPRIWGKEHIIKAIKSSARLRALVPQVYGLGDLSVIIDERAVEQTKALLGHWLPKLKSYVATTAHDQAVRALDEYGAVLLLGNPSTGKSTIGAILSTIASEDCTHTVLQLTNPQAFERHWNATDRGRFFWIDDAFGSNVLRDDYVQDWTSFFPKVQTALELGNRFLFTSRRHIYKAAETKLGQRNLPIFQNGSAVVDVGRLNSQERAQILYNHINFGSQSKSWKSRTKPFLEAVAETDGFLPGIAERLGNPAFTKSLQLNQQSLVNFMAEPREHLVKAIEELDAPLIAALILVYSNQGRLQINSPNQAAIDAVATATGVSFAKIGNCIGELDGSFLKSSQINGEHVWEFEHPTIADALTKILDRKPQMLAALLRGADSDKILSDFVCEGVKSIRDAVTIPHSLNEVLVERLLDVPDEAMTNRTLFQFLSTRANNEVFRNVVTADPQILDRRAWSWGHAWIDPKIEVHARAFSHNLLTDYSRDETACLLEEAALNNFDLSFFEDDQLLALIPPQRLIALGAKVRMALELDIEETISDIGSDADLDEDADSHFETISEGLRILEEITGVDREEDEAFQNAYSAIESEVEVINERKEEKRQEEDDDYDPDWMSAPVNTLVAPGNSPETITNDTNRSIFDDVDK